MEMVPIQISTNLAETSIPAETSVTEFCYKRVNLFLEELINVNVKLFLIHELFRMAKFPEISHFFNLHDSSLGGHVNAASSKSLEISRHSWKTGFNFIN